PRVVGVGSVLRVGPVPVLIEGVLVVREEQRLLEPVGQGAALLGGPCGGLFVREVFGIAGQQEQAVGRMAGDVDVGDVGFFALGGCRFVHFALLFVVPLPAGRYTVAASGGRRLRPGGWPESANRLGVLRRAFSAVC